MTSGPESIPIGASEQEIFNCPVCARPLAVGSRQCPACGTRLIRGVPLAKASGFVAAGLVVGLLVGVGGAAGYGALNPTVRPSTGNQGGASVQPGNGGGTNGGANQGSGGSGGSGGAGTGTVYVSGIVSSSLMQAAAVNVKLAEASNLLRQQLDASKLSPEDTAAILRSIASNAQFGAELAPRIGTWDAANDLSLDLATFYESVRETARDGLGISLTSNSGYRQAATDMIRTLRQLRSLQAAATELGGSANIPVPALPRTP